MTHTHTLALAMTDQAHIEPQEISNLIVREVLSDNNEGGEDVVSGLLQAYMAIVDRGDGRAILVPFEEAEEIFLSEYKAAYKAETGKEIKDGDGLGWWPDQMGKENWPVHLVKRIARLSAAQDILFTRSCSEALKDDVSGQ